MIKDKKIVTAGLMPALALCILMAFEQASSRAMLPEGPAAYAAVTACDFLLPSAVLLYLGRGKEGFPKRFHGAKVRWIPFTVLISLTLPLLSFLINWLTARVFSAEYTAESALLGSTYPLWIQLVTAILLPALCEELFFRGALLPAMEEESFYGSLLFSALAFALIHGDLHNLLGPLAVGLVYGYMTYITNSVWPAVFAHCVNNGMTFVIGRLLQQYAAVGLWDYFLIGVILIFCLLLYFAMGRLEKLTERGRVPRIRQAGLRKIPALLASPGSLVLVVLFAARLLWKL